MLFIHKRNPEEMRVVGEGLQPPPEVNFPDLLSKHEFRFTL